MAYATVEDYTDIFGASGDERIEAHLDLVSRNIDWEFHRRGLPLPSESEDGMLLDKVRLKTVEVVHRYLVSESADETVTQWTQTAGPYSFTATNPYTGSRLNLNKVDLRDLGLSGSRAGFSTEEVPCGTA